MAYKVLYLDICDCIEDYVYRRFLIVSLTFGPEGPGVPGGPCFPGKPLPGKPGRPGWPLSPERHTDTHIDTVIHYLYSQLFPILLKEVSKTSNVIYTVRWNCK